MNLTPNQELEVIHKRKNGTKLINIIKEFGISKSTVYSIIRRNGIRKVGNKKYQVDDSFFEKIDTEDKAYWLGFLYADGCIFTRKKYGYVQIRLSIKDKSQIEKFNNVLNSNYKIVDSIGSLRHFYKNEIAPKNRKIESKISTVRITNMKMVNDLIDKGCFKNKSLSIRYPDFIDSELECHFIRGYFDGDGCVSRQNYKNKSKIDIVGSFDFINTLKVVLENKGINNISLVKQGKICRLQIYKYIETVKFYNLLYSDINSSSFLNRKKEKFDKELYKIS